MDKPSGNGAGVAVTEEPLFTVTKKQWGALMTFVSEASEQKDAITEVTRQITEVSAQVRKQGEAVESHVRAIETAVSETATSAKGFKEALESLSNITATLDPQGQALIERRMTEAVQAALMGVPEALAENFARSAHAPLARLAGQTFEQALTDLRGAKPKGQGATLLLAGIAAACSAATAFLLYQAFANATPDKFRVEGAEGTTVKDERGNVLARIA